MRKPRNRLLEAFTVAASIALALLASVASTQAVLYHYDSEKAERTAALAVAHVEAIAADSIAASHSAFRGSQRCSPDDLDALRQIALQASHLSDVGRIADGRIVCTALWGKLADAVKLPNPGYQRSHFKIWRSADVPGTRYEDTNLVARGELLTVSSPSAFDDLDPERKGRILVYTKDNLYVFKVLEAREKQDLLSPYVIERHACSNSVDACASVRLRRTAAWHLPSSSLLAIAVGSIVIGSTVSIWLLRRRHRPRGLDERLASALQKGLIAVEYQPLCNAFTGQVLGWEALSRWTTPSGEVISPEIFVPLAQIHGLGPTLARYVVQRSLSELRTRLRDRSLYVCVNVEPADVADIDFPSYVRAAVDRKDISPAQLKFEVTERTDIIQPEFLKNMQAMQAEGFCFLIDDFGTGNANFSHLAKTRFDGVKIDRLFTSALGTPSPLRSVLPAIYELAKTLDLDVTVEGVESGAQLDVIRQIAPKATVQGWHLGRPQPAEMLDIQ